MTAIWPAGPPKLMNPSFSQNQKASPRLTDAGPIDGAADAWSAGADPRSGVSPVMGCSPP